MWLTRGITRGHWRHSWLMGRHSELTLKTCGSFICFRGRFFFFLPHVLVLLIKKEKNLLADYLVALSGWEEKRKFIILPGL